ncbi:hypothetical protein AGMMS49992_32950 [Clostridia bacterium]|nr:hypothetical protein AGMMS49992_32950 [Clostridia bacterium]
MLNLRRYRLQKKLSTYELAKELQISRRTYNGYELETRRAPLPFLVRAADYYGVTVDELIDHKPLVTLRTPPDAA